MIPPPREPTKSRETLAEERASKVRALEREGYLSSELLKAALLKVVREDFILRVYRDYAYREVPLPLPGENATISCPHSYPLFYEPLGLDKGHRFLEVGAGSGYGAAVAYEVVGPHGLVVTIEIDPVTKRCLALTYDLGPQPHGARLQDLRKSTLAFSPIDRTLLEKMTDLTSRVPDASH